ncbi:MAG: site-specific DNA-methyltransferase [Spirochaetales bacterium]|nr:site-specific DNA-methyltransferase [Spirochaetales bacterium]
MAEKIKPRFTVKEERIEKFKQLFPEAVADGEINWDALKEALGEFQEDDSREHFGLTWPGKKEARKMAFLPPKGTLKLAQGEGVNEETTENLFIEGDNLEVLKLLQKSYFGRIKMIYIDPPYNTGNDFIYSDNFTDTIEDYLRKTGQLDEEGKALSTNPKTSGRFHSRWLSMMYPRLLLAKNLLRDDGVIFVSIDDNEVHNLRQIMNEIFGEENFQGVFIWKRRQNPDNRNISRVSIDHEFIVLYSKTNNCILAGKAIDVTKYKNKDNDPRGPWASIDLTGLATKEQRPNLHFDIIDPKTGYIYPPNPNRGWSKCKERILEMIEDNRILFPPNKKGRPREKKFLKDLNNIVTGFSTIFNNKRVGYTTDGTREVTDLFGTKYFDFPKPINLLIEIFNQILKNEDIILDFFAGSGTTAHAFLQFNKEDSINRKFIMVQLPEPTDPKSEACKAGYSTIAEIGKERIRRVIKKLNEEDNNTNSQDRGFKVLKLSESNLIKWDESKAASLEELEKQLPLFTEPLAEGWKKEDLLIEVLLWEGFSLTSRTEKKKAGQNTFVCVTDTAMEYRLWACFDEKLEFTIKEFAAVGFAKEDIIVFLDASLTDAIKSRLSDLCRLKVV